MHERSARLSDGFKLISLLSVGVTSESAIDQ